MQLGDSILYPVGITESCQVAARLLEKASFSLTDHPTPEITHLLLDVPSFGADGLLKDGSDLKELLRRLPGTITIIGGNLSHTALASYKIIDLLKDPAYLAKNAAITAECALQVAAPYLKTTFADSSALILGWGRIGKCLTKLLAGMGCTITVAARKEADRAMVEALGHRAVEFSLAPKLLTQYHILFNTVPELPFPENMPLDKCICIDLASSPGMDNWNAVTARGLPGKYAPETTGKLMAQTILKLIQEASL